MGAERSTGILATIYEVKENDCISSIALEHGHIWETLWNDPNNAELKSERKDPNILHKRDHVSIPEIRIRKETVPSDAKHSFIRLGVPAKLRIRFMEDKIDEEAEEPDCPEPNSDGINSESESAAATTAPLEQVPCANIPYSIDIDGKLSDGTTDSDGYIDIPLIPNAKRAIIRMNLGTEKENVLEVKLGHLDPISEIAGVKKRLQNLTFDCGDQSDEDNSELSSAIEAFQEQQGMEINGILSDEVRAKLQTIHGS